jgi:hypothetical protein
VRKSPQTFTHTASVLLGFFKVYLLGKPHVHEWRVSKAMKEERTWASPPIADHTDMDTQALHQVAAAINDMLRRTEVATTRRAQARTVESMGTGTSSSALTAIVPSVPGTVGSHALAGAAKENPPALSDRLMPLPAPTQHGMDTATSSTSHGHVSPPPWPAVVSGPKSAV